MLAKQRKQFPTIIWPSDYWDMIESDESDIAYSFLLDIESHLGVTHSKVSFRGVWERDPPRDAGTLSLHAYMIKES